MTTVLPLQQIIGKLSEENKAQLETFAAFLLDKQQKTKTVNGKKSDPRLEVPAGEERGMPEQLKIARQFKGIAKYPHTPTNKHEAYEQ